MNQMMIWEEKRVMRYKVDHDLHIHSHLSLCSDDEEQTPQNILQIAKAKGLKAICVTDHYWDDLVPCNTKYNWWYEKQNFEHISRDFPMPEDEEVTFLFGCETDVDSSNRIGIPKERWNDFDFIIISTTHFHHMTGPDWENCNHQETAKHWVDRLDAVLNTELPFEKVGIAHLACGLIAGTREDVLASLDSIPTEDMRRLFTKAATLGVGIELNYSDMNFKDEEAESILRIFRIAKECGCKFYLGSDAHERWAFENVDVIFERAIDMLELKEEDKFAWLSGQ